MINVLSDKYGFICTVSFTPELATMQIIDTQDVKQALLFTSPMSTAKLTAVHDIQNLGAVQTYLRRYLYLCAFEIVEHDPIDTTSGANTSTQKPKDTSQGKQKTPPENSSTDPKVEAEGKALVRKIAEIMKSVDQSNQAFFTDKEKGEAKKIINEAPKNAEGVERLRAFVEYLEKQRADRDIQF